VLTVIVMAAACRGAGADVDAVRAQIAREVAAVNARDLQALSQIWSQEPDITLFDITPPGRFQGWTAIARTFGDFFERTGAVHMTVDHVEVRLDGELAWATYDWAMTGKMGEAPLDDSGQATAVYRREKDGWRLVHAHYSATLLPPQPGGGQPPAAGGQGPGSGAQAPEAGGGQPPAGPKPAGAGEGS
jgi:ketosteroid isomerase-like protein